MIADALLSAREDLSKLTNAWATIGEVMDFGVPSDQGEATGTASPGWMVTMTNPTGGAAVDVQILTSAADNLGTPTTMGTVTFTNAGGQAFIPVAKGDWLRYVAIQAKGSSTAFSTGELRVDFMANERNWRAYPAETGR